MSDTPTSPRGSGAGSQGSQGRPHRIQLQQGVKDGHLTGHCRAWCSCGQLDIDSRAVVVASAMLAHQGASNDGSSVHLVIMDRGGLFGAFMDPALAHKSAQAIAAVVVSLPITADYRGLKVADARAETEVDAIGGKTGDDDA